MKKLIILAFLLTLLILIYIVMAGFQGKKPSLDFKSCTFDVYLDKSIYYYKAKSKELYFLEKGSINSGKLIWKGDITERDDVFVSPNSKYILVRSGYKLFLISNTGEILKTFYPFANIYEFSEDPKTPVRWGSEIQWLRDSSGFVINNSLLKKNYKSKRQSDMWDTSLMFVSISDEEPKVILPNIWVIGDFSISKNKDRILYEATTPDGDVLLKVHNIGDDQNNDTNILKKDVNVNDWFFNFQQESFGDSSFHRNYDNSYSIVVKGDLVSINKEGYRKTLISVKKDGVTPIKNFLYTFYLNDACFLPGNRFFSMYVDSKEYSGQIIIDVIENKLKTIENTYFFFSLTTDEVSDYSLGGFELIKADRFDILD